MNLKLCGIAILGATTWDALSYTYGIKSYTPHREILIQSSRDIR